MSFRLGVNCTDFNGRSILISALYGPHFSEKCSAKNIFRASYLSFLTISQHK